MSSSIRQRRKEQYKGSFILVSTGIQAPEPVGPRPTRKFLKSKDRTAPCPQNFYDFAPHQDHKNKKKSGPHRINSHRAVRESLGVHMFSIIYKNMLISE